MFHILQNTRLAVPVRPECGGRIDQIVDLARNKAWLWHPEGYDPAAPRVLADDASFDASWQGGFEEMFPNDAACTLNERALPDHGETWSVPWTVSTQNSHGLSLLLDCTTVPVRLEKHLTLEQDEPVLHLRYDLTNLGDAPLPCMLKLHPALAIEEGDEIELPDCEVEPVAPGFGRAAGSEPTRWPHVRGADGNLLALDRALPAAEDAREFVYCSGLEHGRCGVRNVRTGSRLQMEFDRTAFPFVWVFQSYGGFQGHYVLMLEPCTSKLYDLNEVIARDTALWLAPQARRSFEVRIRVD